MALYKFCIIIVIVIILIIIMSGFMKMGLKNWTPNLDFNELLGLL